MTTRDLLEMAALDVLGLLDEEEREAFESAFRAASPEVQAQVRREQTRFARIDGLLPDVEPPAGLKARVMAAVRGAISRLAGAAEADPIPEPIPFPVRKRAMLFWRAACICFASATVGLAIFSYEVARTNERIASLMETNETLDLISQQLGVRFVETTFASDREFIDFAPAAADFTGESRATMVVSREKRTAVVLCDKLPVPDGVYTLIITSDDGQQQQIVKKFEATGGLVAVPVQVSQQESPDCFDRMSVVGPTSADSEPEVIFFAKDKV